jgi:hypothetical protein
MKSLAYLILLSLLIFGYHQNTYSQTDINGGHISGSWTLSDSPYRIFDDITIPDDSTLTIEAGVEIKFQGHSSIYVQGHLLATGTATDSIVFAINDTTGFSDPNVISGGWNGIRIIDTGSENDSSIFEYCVFKYGKAVASYWHDNSGGAVCIIHFDKVRISHCLFISNSAGGSEVPAGGAIHLAWSDIQLNDNTLLNNQADGGGAIHMHESDPVFMRNNIAHNLAREGGGISIGSLSNPTFNGDSIMNNQASQFGGGIMCRDQSVVSFEDVVIQGNKAPWGGGLGLGGVEASMNDCLIQDNAADNLGGGIAADFSTVVINNSLIKSNSASMSGGIHAWYDTLQINDSEISNNKADFGGGLHADYSQLEFLNCKFIENEATNGGGLHLWNCDLDLEKSEFKKNNVTSESGAIQFNLADTLVFGRPYNIRITESQFIENNADFRSGGVKIEQNDTVISFADIIIDKCSFVKNHAERVAGILIVGMFEDFLLSNSKFSNNITNLWNGCASFALGCAGTIVNCDFTDNQAILGNPGASGVSNGSFVHYINCTFANNTAESVGGLSAHRDGKATVTNCIFWNNSPKQIAVRGIREGAFSEMHINYSNIQYGIDSIDIDTLALLHWGTGNIDSDPLFYDPDNGDFHLMDESPCIDAGIDSIDLNGQWYYAPMFDIEGYSRPQGGSTLVDMGAYENQEVLALINEFREDPFMIKAYPNPFNQIVNFELNLKQPAWVSIRIYNFLGGEVAYLINQKLESGTHQLSWDAPGRESGIYICRINIMDKIITEKVLLMR